MKFLKISTSTLAHSGGQTVHVLYISSQLQSLYLQINNFTKGFGHCIIGLALVIVQSCDIQRKTAKNVIFRFWAIFRRGPYVQLYEFEFLTYPKPHSLLYSSYFQLHGPNDYPGAPIPKLQNDVFNIIKSKKSSNLIT